MLLSLTCLYITQMTAWQSISTAQTTVSDKITGLFGHNEKLPEIDPKGIVDISKATIEQYEQLSANLPLNQWVYLENEKQGIYQLQNKSTEGFVDALVSVYLVIAVIYILINVAINKAAVYVSHKTGATIIR